MAFSGAQVTRLGASGIPRFLYGSFAGKEEALPLGTDCFVDFIALMDEDAINLQRGFGLLLNSELLQMEDGAQEEAENGDLMECEVEFFTDMQIGFGPQTIDLRSVLTDAPLNIEAVICND